MQIRRSVRQYRHRSQQQYIAGLPGPLYSGHRLLNAIKQPGMITRLDAQNEVHVVGFQRPDVRPIGTESILGDNHVQMRVIPAKPLHKAFGGIALTVLGNRYQLQLCEQFHVALD